MNMLQSVTTQSAALALCLIAACCTANASDNVVQVADKAGNFKTLIAAAKAAGLAYKLQEDGPFTIFAPTDEAFSKLPEGLVGELLKPENKLKFGSNGERRFNLEHSPSAARVSPNTSG